MFAMEAAGDDENGEAFVSTIQLQNGYIVVTI
jgi:hypothetical protein